MDDPDLHMTEGETITLKRHGEAGYTATLAGKHCVSVGDLCGTPVTALQLLLKTVGVEENLGGPAFARLLKNVFTKADAEVNEIQIQCMNAEAYYFWALHDGTVWHQGTAHGSAIAAIEYFEKEHCSEAH